MLKELLKKSRSYRGFDQSVIPSREQLEDLVDCTRYAPSGANRQPLKYYLVNRPEETAKVQKYTRWARALPDRELPHPGHCPTACIIICQDTDITKGLNACQMDVGIAAQTIMLRAAEMGLGGCMVGSFEKEKVREELGIPENLAPMLVLALGVPDETVVLTGVGADGKTDYYRDAQDVHYVPKRTLREIVLPGEEQ